MAILVRITLVLCVIYALGVLADVAEETKETGSAILCFMVGLWVVACAILIWF